VWVDGGVTPHHQSPTSAMEPAGQDLGSALALGTDDSTAPIAAECQSFLDNVIAQFDGVPAFGPRRCPVLSARMPADRLFVAVKPCQGRARLWIREFEYSRPGGQSNDGAIMFSPVNEECQSSVQFRVAEHEGGRPAVAYRIRPGRAQFP